MEPADVPTHAIIHHWYLKSGLHVSQTYMFVVDTDS